jgi:suppressor for copper-sensitivity B
MARLFGLLSCLLIFSAAMTLDARADEGWVGDDHAAVRLIAASRATGSEQALDIGLQFRLGKGWHSYWRSPGDAGFPASVDWAGSSNLKSAELAWPVPTRFTQQGFETLGYEDSFVLPIQATLAEPGKPLALKASVDYLACAAICVPFHADLTLVVPAGAAAPTDYAGAIAEARKAVPGAPEAVGLHIGASEITAGDKKAVLRVEVTANPPLGAADLYVEGIPGNASATAATVERQGGRTRLVVPIYSASAEAMAGKPLTLTLVDGKRAAEFQATPQLGQAQGGSGLAIILLIALLGGLVLNFMPCVLPVLSLKLLAVIDHSAGGRRELRAGFLATAGGIIASFLALAGLAIGVKSAGGAVGWGIQFQQPVFLIAMALLLVLFALSLFDRLELNLPGFLSGIGNRESKRRALNAFLSGAFATLLATPCSAPFVGTALGFALSAGPLEIGAIFAALGLGFAAPYLAVAAVPALARLLPRPGRWMTRLRQALGILLAGTAAWLVLVLVSLVGPNGAAVVALALCLVALLLIAAKRGRGWMRPAALAAGLIAFAPLLTGGPGETAKISASALWQPFDEAQIPELIGQGNVVVVDVTADWCLTCKVNKLAVLDREPVARLLHRKGVLARRADWTRPNPAIAAYLEKFGRYGIPFNAVYGPLAPNGIALPELLTADALKQAIEQAGGPKMVADL